MRRHAGKYATLLFAFAVIGLLGRNPELAVPLFMMAASLAWWDWRLSPRSRRRRGGLDTAMQDAIDEARRSDDRRTPPVVELDG